MGHKDKKKTKHSVSFLLNSPSRGSSSRSVQVYREEVNHRDSHRRSLHRQSSSGNISRTVPGQQHQTPVRKATSSASSGSKPSSALMKPSSGKRWTCSTCGLRLKTHAAWVYHQLQVHQNTNVGMRGQQYPCTFGRGCREIFPEERSLEFHMISHMRSREKHELECEVCGLKVHTRLAMQRHRAWGHSSPGGSSSRS